MPSQHHYEVMGGAVIRALTGNSDLQWSGKTLYEGINPIGLYAAHQQDVSDALADQRALLDGAALRLLHSDQKLHEAHSPEDEIEGLVYELLEQLRVESLAPENLPGLSHNLSNRFLKWAQDFIDSGLTETSLGILLFTISVTCWSRLNGKEVPDRMGDLMEATRANITPELGPHLAALRPNAGHQDRFCVHALAISRWVGEAISSAKADAAGHSKGFKSRNGFALRLHFEPPHAQTPPVAVSGESSSWQATGQQYRVFTRAYDLESDATDLVRSAQLSEFRAQMDEELLQCNFNIPRLARIFSERLSDPKRDRWQFGKEAGYIDSARLSQLVSDPDERLIFKEEENIAVMHTAVGILMDCSGSMKAHAQPLSLIIDALGRALDMAGITTEILGFSTLSWNGGRARRDWQRAGKPQYPGRLNEVQHLIFKSGLNQWRKGRRGIAALRRLDLFREGIDGEAVQWAYQRLAALPVSRRILVVISDGCPMDSATHQCNDDRYLDEHLRQVVGTLERQGAVEICGLGVGLDLGCFYRHRLAIDLSEGIDEGLLIEIANLITSYHLKTNRH